jgi:hypothetical protein
MGYLNQELIKQGWCWWNRKYAPGNTALEGLEMGARETEKGLIGESAAAAAGSRETTGLTLVEAVTDQLVIRSLDG